MHFQLYLDCFLSVHALLLRQLFINFFLILCLQYVFWLRVCLVSGVSFAHPCLARCCGPHQPCAVISGDQRSLYTTRVRTGAASTSDAPPCLAAPRAPAPNPIHASMLGQQASGSSQGGSFSCFLNSCDSYGCLVQAKDEFLSVPLSLFGSSSKLSTIEILQTTSYTACVLLFRKPVNYLCSHRCSPLCACPQPHSCAHAGSTSFSYKSTPHALLPLRCCPPLHPSRGHCRCTSPARGSPRNWAGTIRTRWLCRCITAHRCVAMSRLIVCSHVPLLILGLSPLPPIPL